MKYIHITNSFKKQLKKLKKYLNEDNLVDDVDEFIRSGTKTGETLLKEVDKFDCIIQFYKLRLSVKMVDFRYVLAVVSGIDYIPIAIDLKKGRYGVNLRFEAKSDIKIFLNNSIDNSMKDYIENSEENNTVTIYEID